MSLEFPRRPKTAKGAIMALRPDSRIFIDPDTPTLIFQYNPEMLAHTFSSTKDDEELSQKDGKSDAAQSQS